jgi:hypothetical protein
MCIDSVAHVTAGVCWVNTLAKTPSSVAKTNVWFGLPCVRSDNAVDSPLAPSGLPLPHVHPIGNDQQQIKQFPIWSVLRDLSGL